MLSPQTRSAAIKAKVAYWPNKKIYYSKSSAFTANETNSLNIALQRISEQTNIIFEETNTNMQYMLNFLAPGNSNNSPIGMQKGGNPIQLQKDFPVGACIHEVMHSLGFFHEHTRTDRDNWINVHFENMLSGKEKNFKKYES